MYRQSNNLGTTECHSSCQRQTQFTAAIKALKAAEMSVAHSDRKISPQNVDEDVESRRRNAQHVLSYDDYIPKSCMHFPQPSKKDVIAGSVNLYRNRHFRSRVGGGGKGVPGGQKFLRDTCRSGVRFYVKFFEYLTSPKSPTESIFL